MFQALTHMTFSPVVQYCKDRLDYQNATIMYPTSLDLSQWEISILFSSRTACYMFVKKAGFETGTEPEFFALTLLSRCANKGQRRLTLNNLKVAVITHFKS